NKLDCEGYRLPTELEWEFLAKGGKNHRYSGGFDEAGRSGWVQVNSQKQAHQVAGKPANPFGLFDMTGNVAEWVWGGPFTYGKSAEVGPTNAKLMGVRGGSWDDEDAATRTDRRRFDKPKKPLSTVGFRLVRGAR
ncbi:MAG: sulfatase modifying factor 1, partial [Kiritimatiellia bacterium]